MNETVSQLQPYLKFCPLCGSILTQKECFDKFVIRWSCEKSHEWYTGLSEFTAKSCAHGLGYQVKSDDPAQIIRYWITVPELRQYLHPQTAEALRAMIRKIDDPEYGKNNPWPPNYRFCLTCGYKTKSIPPDDWDNPLECENGHHQRSRGGRIGRYIKNENDPTKGLHADITLETLPSNGYMWLESLSKPTRAGIFGFKKKPSSFVPNQIVELLPRLKKIFCEGSKP